MRAKEGSPVLTEKLAEAGVSFCDIPLYETWVDKRRQEELNRIIRETDYVAVASSSAVKALHGMLDNKEDIQAKLISIGPSTTKTAEELGFRVWRTAAEYTAEGMVAAILGDVVPG